MSRSQLPPHGYAIGEHRFAAAPLAAGLYVTASPIGNLGDVTLRALETLAAADLVLCEDTRVSLRLLDRYRIAAPLQAYHDHNAAKVRPRVLARLAAGAAVALLSDAGTPLLSDPGFKLVREAAARGIAVRTVPGASAVPAALAVAGLPTDRFLFVGFLPAKPGQRRKALGEIAGIAATLVIFEAPQRLGRTLAELAEALGPRPAAIARELTKIHEEVLRASLPELAETIATRTNLKGEITLVVGPPQHPPAANEAALDDALREALEGAPAGRAAAAVAQRFGLARRQVYARALALKVSR